MNWIGNIFLKIIGSDNCIQRTIIRGILKSLGGALVAKGLCTDGDMQAAVGAIMTVIGFAWGVFDAADHQGAIVAAKAVQRENENLRRVLAPKLPVALLLVGMGLMGLMGLMTGCQTTEPKAAAAAPAPAVQPAPTNAVLLVDTNGVLRGAIAGNALVLLGSNGLFQIVNLFQNVASNQVAIDASDNAATVAIDTNPNSKAVKTATIKIGTNACLTGPIEIETYEHVEPPAPIHSEGIFASLCHFGASVIGTVAPWIGVGIVAKEISRPSQTTYSNANNPVNAAPANNNNVSSASTVNKTAPANNTVAPVNNGTL